MLEQKLYFLEKNAPTDPNQTALFWFGLVWFGNLDFILIVSQTKPHVFLFKSNYLVKQNCCMTSNLSKELVLNKVLQLSLINQV